jgi:hypothetical protein
VLHKKLTQKQTKLRWKHLTLTPERKTARAWRCRRNRIASNMLFGNPRLPAVKALVGT